jgi:hypothetical protein
LLLLLLMLLFMVVLQCNQQLFFPLPVVALVLSPRHAALRHVVFIVGVKQISAAAVLGNRQRRGGFR